MAKIVRLIGVFADAHQLGTVACGDPGVITRRNPDSVRGPDIAFYLAAKLAGIPDHDDFLSFPPDLVVEILSPNDRNKDTLRRVTEFLEAGVLVVAVFDPRKLRLVQHRPDGDVEVLNAEDVWTVPELLPGFAVKVKELAGIAAAKGDCP